jgi:hypothetical protein
MLIDQRISLPIQNYFMNLERLERVYQTAQKYDIRNRGNDPELGGNDPELDEFMLSMPSKRAALSLLRKSAFTLYADLVDFGYKETADAIMGIKYKERILI